VTAHVWPTAGQGVRPQLHWLLLACCHCCCHHHLLPAFTLSAFVPAAAVAAQVRDNALVVSAEYVRIIITCDKVSENGRWMLIPLAKNSFSHLPRAAS